MAEPVNENIRRLRLRHEGYEEVVGAHPGHRTRQVEGDGFVDLPVLSDLLRYPSFKVACELRLKGWRGLFVELFAPSCLQHRDCLCIPLLGGERRHYWEVRPDVHALILEGLQLRLASRQVIAGSDPSRA